nr:trafficking protein particle complex subunit 8 isoform X2 [Ipomoea batatas]
MSVHNSSDFPVSVSVGPADSSASLSSASSASPASDNEVGWHALPQMNDIKVASDIPRAPKTLVSESTAPFIWSGSSWTHFKLEPLSSTEIPLQITVFSPGTYELSNYLLHWSFLSSGDQGDKGDVLRPTGTCEGHPYYITVLPQD